MFPQCSFTMKTNYARYLAGTLHEMFPNFNHIKLNKPQKLRFLESPAAGSTDSRRSARTLAYSFEYLMNYTRILMKWFSRHNQPKPEPEPKLVAIIHLPADGTKLCRSFPRRCRSL